MLRKILIGGLIGVAAEIVYLLSMVHDYPYQYLPVILFLSIAEGITIFLSFDRLQLLPTQKAYFTHASLLIAYVTVRIITRILGITAGEGASLLLQDFTRVMPLQFIFVFVAFVVSTTALFVILYCLFFIISLITRTASRIKQA